MEKSYKSSKNSDETAVDRDAKLYLAAVEVLSAFDELSLSMLYDSRLARALQSLREVL